MSWDRSSCRWEQCAQNAPIMLFFWEFSPEVWKKICYSKENVCFSNLFFVLFRFGSYFVVFYFFSSMCLTFDFLRRDWISQLLLACDSTALLHMLSQNALNFWICLRIKVFRNCNWGEILWKVLIMPKVVYAQQRGITQMKHEFVRVVNFRSDRWYVSADSSGLIEIPKSW